MIPLWREGNLHEARPHELTGCRGADFRDDTAYAVNLFDLVLSLYAIPLNHPASEKYLKSPNCCFELVQIAKHGEFAGRIFPIVLAEAKIYDPAERGRFIEHWEKKKDDLDEVMKRVSAANMEGFREDIDLYAEIRALLPKLIDVLKNMNALTPEIHQRR